MKVEIPEPLAELVRQRVAERGHASAEEYVRKLILDDDTDRWWASLSEEERRAREDFSRMLREAEASGPPMTLEEVRAAVERERAEWRADRGSPPIPS